MNNSLSESDLLSKIFPLIKKNENVIVPPGDDCAVISIAGTNLLLTTDQVIENKHYLPQTSPYLVGKKLMARNLSDIAAMGGTPHFALLASASFQKNSSWLIEFHRGVIEEGEKFGVTLIGGDLATTHSETVHSLTLIGSLNGNCILRNGAKEGDFLFCTGEIGNSFESEHHLHFSPRISESQLLAKYATAMIDITDGFLIDLKRICLQSQLSAKINLESLPLRKYNGVTPSFQKALTDGEDYELLVAIPQKYAEQLLNEWSFSTQLTKIGIFTKNSTVIICDENNNDLIASFGEGYDHFK